MDVLKDIDKAKNLGLRVYDQDIVTYEQIKFGLSVYYNKRYVLADDIHTRFLNKVSQSSITNFS